MGGAEIPVIVAKITEAGLLDGSLCFIGKDTQRIIAVVIQCVIPVLHAQQNRNAIMSVADSKAVLVIDGSGCIERIDIIPAVSKQIFDLQNTGVVTSVSEDGFQGGGGAGGAVAGVWRTDSDAGRQSFSLVSMI